MAMAGVHSRVWVCYRFSQVRDGFSESEKENCLRQNQVSMVTCTEGTIKNEGSSCCCPI